jgi:hypothetical protein
MIPMIPIIHLAIPHNHRMHNHLTQKLPLPVTTAQPPQRKRRCVRHAPGETNDDIYIALAIARHVVENTPVGILVPVACCPADERARVVSHTGPPIYTAFLPVLGFG